MRRLPYLHDEFPLKSWALSRRLLQTSFMHPSWLTTSTWGSFLWTPKPFLPGQSNCPWWGWEQERKEGAQQNHLLNSFHERDDKFLFSKCLFIFYTYSQLPILHMLFSLLYLITFISLCLSSQMCSRRSKS